MSGGGWGSWAVKGNNRRSNSGWFRKELLSKSVNALTEELLGDGLNADSTLGRAPADNGESLVTPRAEKGEDHWGIPAGRNKGWANVGISDIPIAAGGRDDWGIPAGKEKKEKTYVRCQNMHLFMIGDVREPLRFPKIQTTDRTFTVRRCNASGTLSRVQGPDWELQYRLH